MSSDVAVIQAALGGISAAMKDSKDKSFKPYIMISVNDDDDLHFRKASFNPKYCPTDCLRPCEKVCPALAIPPQNITITNNYKQIDIVDSKNSNSSNGNGHASKSYPKKRLKSLKISLKTYFPKLKKNESLSSPLPIRRPKKFLKNSDTINIMNIFRLSRIN
jgi:hypothetical protein